MAELAVFAALLDEKGWLLLGRRRDPDLWEMPGGRVEVGEPPWDAIRREVAEETGLEVEVRRLVGMYWREPKDLLVLQFECGWRGEPTTTSEFRDVRFFALDSLPEPINPVVAERIEDMRGDPMKLHMKAQRGPSGYEWAEAWSRSQGT